MLASIWDVFLASAPWLVFGLFISGLIKAWLPVQWVGQNLGAGARFGVTKAALVGAPLPLCSCGVIPVALGVRQQGATKSATVSFLVSTPETGAESIALTYALMGPLMAIVRPIAAIFSAITTGSLVKLLVKEDLPGVPAEATQSCCASKSNTNTHQQSARKPTWTRVSDGLKFSFYDLLSDILNWLIIGIIIAGVMLTFVSPETLSEYGRGPFAMLIMLLIGIPMYVCAAASTPIAAALLVAGVSPGVVMVFLLAGPATNIATVGIIKKELGTKTAVIYLSGVAGASIACGLILDALLGQLDLDVTATITHHHHSATSAAELSAYALLAWMVFLLYKKWQTTGQSKLF